MQEYIPYQKLNKIKAKWLKIKTQCGSRFWNGKKILKRFQDCHENALIQSFEMSPHLICLECGTKTLLWPASGMGLEQAGHKRVWERLLQTIKWGLILKLWLRAFTWQSWNPLRIFLPFQNLLPLCVGLRPSLKRVGYSTKLRPPPPIYDSRR